MSLSNYQLVWNPPEWNQESLQPTTIKYQAKEIFFKMPDLANINIKHA